MKKVLTVAASVVAVIAAFEVNSPAVTIIPGKMRDTVTLSWEYPTNEVPDAFNLYGTTTTNTPADWHFLAIVSGNYRQVTLTNIPYSQNWFYATASNAFNGESIPSNIAPTPNTSDPASNLAISALGRGVVLLTWNYNTNKPPDVWKIYATTDVSAPATNWTLAATVSAPIHAVSFSNLISQSLYLVRGSNWWGEVPPSNIVGTPPVLGAVVNLRVLK